MASRRCKTIVLIEWLSQRYLLSQPSDPIVLNFADVRAGCDLCTEAADYYVVVSPSEMNAIAQRGFAPCNETILIGKKGYSVADFAKMCGLKPDDIDRAWKDWSLTEPDPWHLCVPCSRFVIKYADVRTCDVCGGSVRRDGGYVVHRDIVAASDYFVRIILRMMEARGIPRQQVPTIISDMLASPTPWMLCDTCARSIIAAASDHTVAREFAKRVWQGEHISLAMLRNGNGC
jgi:hypothetical protein